MAVILASVNQTNVEAEYFVMFEETGNLTAPKHAEVCADRSHAANLQKSRWEGGLRFFFTTIAQDQNIQDQQQNCLRFSRPNPKTGRATVVVAMTYRALEKESHVFYITSQEGTLQVIN